MSIARDVRELLGRGLRAREIVRITGHNAKAVDGAIHRARHLAARQAYERERRRTDPGNAAYARAYQAALRDELTLPVARAACRAAAAKARAAIRADLIIETSGTAASA